MLIGPEIAINIDKSGVISAYGLNPKLISDRNIVNESTWIEK